MIYDLIIVGGGPAGMTAGIYAARQKLNTLLITKDFGGQIAKKTVNIENYPGFQEVSGTELVERMEKQLRKQEIEIKIDEVGKIEKIDKSFFVATKNKDKFESKTLIIASGAIPKLLKVPGENKFLGRGISYCALCDGPFFSDKNVVIIGGGNSAFETAIYLSKIARKIYILEAGEKIKADKENQEIVEKIEKVEIITNAAVKEIQGNDFVQSIIYEDKKNNKDFTIETSGVFIEIGFLPNTLFIKELVDLNEKNEIKVDFETYQTKTPGLFAAGDVNAGKYKQIVSAAGEGVKATLAAYDYLKDNGI